MSKQNPKKYLMAETLFRTKCTDPSSTKFLQNKWYDVIDYKESTRGRIIKVLVQFNSGAAKWYSASRFNGHYSNRVSLTQRRIHRQLCAM